MPLTLGLRLRLMLTLGALAILPVAGVCYVVAHDEVAIANRNLAFQRHDAAVAAQANLSTRLYRRELNLVAAASAIRLHHTNLGAFARRHDAVVEVGGRRYGRLIPDALTARVQLVSAGHRIGTVVAQVRRSGPAPAAAAGAGSVAPVYRRVEEGGALALAALMLLAFVLARPMLRALRWTELRAGESRVDALTQIPNRRALEEALGAEISRAQRFEHELAVLLLDLDHFKKANDTHGHVAGDRLLCEVARLLASGAREGDTVARWGGEEFVAVLPETSLDGAVQLAERLRVAVGRVSLGALHVSASCGVASFHPGDTPETLLAAADAALYRAKESGRNRTEIAPRTGADDFPLPQAS
jgi:diguanylate cyclase (GGDEF)-like protein